MDWPQLPENPYLEICAADEVRVGTSRVLLETVLEEYLRGRAPEEIVAEYPTLQAEAVYGAIAYYLGHKQAVDRYLDLTTQRDRELERAFDERPEPPVLARIRAAQAVKKSA